MTTNSRDRDNGEVSRTVHDSLFKSVFSDPLLAAEELRAVLPPTLVASIDWPTITRVPSDFIDPAFRQRIGDLAFHSQFLGSGEALFWLMEHQSTEDWWMLQRILDMKCVMWWSWRRLNPEARHLPVIVPVVVYNGPRPWRAPRPATSSTASLPGGPSSGAPSAPSPPIGSSSSCSILIVCIAILTPTSSTSASRPWSARNTRNPC